MHSWGPYLCRFVKLSVISLNNFDIIMLKKKNRKNNIATSIMVKIYIYSVFGNSIGVFTCRNFH